eukprot:TRINITY_DN280_c0_g1_i1.p1 TRINITY_DN280_c0_g1~~TRINITY_DN280_c0_g1_i1.p1  ORF type:complete len:207 (-),score=27.39 TRINITY_DN280_c0_g1_i1:299-919(-)
MGVCWGQEDGPRPPNYDQSKGRVSRPLYLKRASSEDRGFSTLPFPAGTAPQPCPQLAPAGYTPSADRGFIVVGMGDTPSPDAVWRERPGVLDAVCVYVGGSTNYPSDKEMSDYSEAVAVMFDPKLTSYEQCLDFFFSAHDCHSSARRQHAKGVWWLDEDQRIRVAGKVAAIEAAEGRKVCTIRAKATPMYRAEDCHQQYYLKQADI